MSDHFSQARIRDNVISPLWPMIKWRFIYRFRDFSPVSDPNHIELRFIRVEIGPFRPGQWCHDGQFNHGGITWSWAAGTVPWLDLPQFEESNPCVTDSRENHSLAGLVHFVVCVERLSEPCLLHKKLPLYKSFVASRYLRSMFWQESRNESDAMLQWQVILETGNWAQRSSQLNNRHHSYVWTIRYERQSVELLYLSGLQCRASFPNHFFVKCVQFSGTSQDNVCPFVRHILESPQARLSQEVSRVSQGKNSVWAWLPNTIYFIYLFD